MFIQKIKSYAPILIFLIGASIFLYPSIANKYALHVQSKVIHTYTATMNEKSKEEIKQIWKQAVEYNDNLAGDPVHDPFVLNSGYVLPENYLHTLNILEDGVMAYIEIPKIHVNLPIYHGVSEDVLAKGAGHIEGTSLPIGGKNRHSIVCAHRGLPSAELSVSYTHLDVYKRQVCCIRQGNSVTEKAACTGIAEKGSRSRNEW